MNSRVLPYVPVFKKKIGLPHYYASLKLLYISILNSKRNAYFDYCVFCIKWTFKTIIDMIGMNDAWNMCINQCIVNGWLFRGKLVKGDYFGRYKIINNERELLDVVYPKPQNAFK